MIERHELRGAGVLSGKLTRRRMLGLMAGTAMGTLLAACADDDDDDVTPDPPAVDPDDDDEPAPDVEDDDVDEDPDEPDPVDDDVADARSGGTLRVATSDDWRVLDPPVYANITDRQVFYAIFDPLVAMTEDLGIEPALAHSWEATDDALTWTFSLNEGVVFHDGTEFNADAVKFNIDRILDPETGSRLRQEVLDIEEVRAVDDFTVEVELSQPFTPLLSWFADVPGMMSSPAAIEEWGEDYPNHPTGAGPFVFVEQVQGDFLQLERFDDYWQEGLPHLDEVIYRPVPDPSVKVSGLRAGSFDVVDEVPPHEVERLEAEGFKITRMDGTRWPMVRLNLEVAPLDDPVVRQALARAVDRESIVQAVYFGGAIPAYGPLSPVYREVFDPEIEEFGPVYDPDGARQLLADAGYADGEVSFTLDVSAANVRMGEILQANWLEIGVDVEVVPYEGQAAFDKMVSGDFEASMGSFTPRPDADGTLRRNFHSESTLNYSQYSNPRVDELMDDVRRLPLGPERIEAFREMQRLIVEDTPWIFLVFESRAIATGANVEGLPAVPDTLLRPGPVWLSD